MEYSFLDLLGTSLIPVLGTDVAAGTSCNVHLGLIAVVTVGALPNELAVLVVGDLDLTVEAAHLTVVALGVELGVHDVVVDELHYTENSLDVVLHIGNLDVGDSAAGRKLLELSLESELSKCIDGLGNVNVIRVGDIVSVGNALYYAEAVLKALCKLVGSALKGSAVEGVVDVLGRLPLCGVLVELLHNIKAELLTLAFGELLAVERVYALPKACITERKCGVTAVEILVDLLALLKTGESAVLPEDGSGVGECAGESLVTALKRSVTELHSLVEYLPESLHILVC